MTPIEFKDQGIFPFNQIAIEDFTNQQSVQLIHKNVPWIPHEEHDALEQ